MIKRQLTSLISKYIKDFPVIVILGARQVGKTTLAKLVAKDIRLKTHYLDLEKNSDLSILANDAESYLNNYSNYCVLIDEVQRMPQLFPLLRALVDEKRKAGRFILTGSASPSLLKGASESLAGRVFYFYLHPLNLQELTEKIAFQKHWFRGGFPKALLSRNNDVWSGWIESFISTYIERDLPILFDVKISTTTMRKLLSMLVHVHSSILNAEKIGSSLDISGTTVKRYLDFLEGAFLITRLQPYYVNIGKRLIKAPKVYINDSGIVHYLLNLKNEKELINHPYAGASWEGYVISQIIYSKKSRIDAYYYRTQAGAECDLVLVRGNNVLACIEIKLSKSPIVSKGFYNAISDLKSKANFVIASTNIDYKSAQGVITTGLKNFLNKYLPKIST